MKHWTNFHSHSVYCDGRSEPGNFIRESIRKGFLAFGCSSHAPVPFQSHWNMPREKLQDYLDTINELKLSYKDQIQVYTGLEIDYIEGYWGYADSFLQELPLDYRIGSVHYLERMSDGSFFCFDGKPEGFFENIELLYNNDFKAAIRKYYHHVRQMVRKDNPDIIGHLDKIKMHNNKRKYFDENETWYIREVEDTIDLIAEKNCIVEVNTRGLYRHDPPMLYPSPWVLKYMSGKNIPVMINSDAHHPSEIDAGYDYAASVLREAGWKTVRILINGTWNDVPFDENGLKTGEITA
ncbi:MAG: histidinol-phosphatase [Bacteroidales bacterium]|nr:histidinol-phosphatase [Bacteroidales bacterium]